MIKQSGCLAAEQAIGRIKGFDRSQTILRVSHDFGRSRIGRAERRKAANGNIGKHAFHGLNMPPCPVENQKPAGGIGFVEQGTTETKPEVSLQNVRHAGKIAKDETFALP